MKGNASHEGKEEDNRNPLKDCDAEDKCDNVVSLQEENLASTFDTTQIDFHAQGYDCSKA